MYFSASYYPLALPLRKSPQYIPCSVVSTLLKTLSEGPPLLQIRPWPALWTCPFAGDLSLTFIGRPLPGAATIGSVPQQKFLLSETKTTKQTKQNKTHPQKKKGGKRKKKCWTICTSVTSAPGGAAASSFPGRVARRAEEIRLPEARFQS